MAFSIILGALVLIAFNNTAELASASPSTMTIPTTTINVKQGERLRMVIDNKNKCDPATKYVLKTMSQGQKKMVQRWRGRCERYPPFSFVHCFKTKCGFGFGQATLKYQGYYLLEKNGKPDRYFNVHVHQNQAKPRNIQKRHAKCSNKQCSSGIQPTITVNITVYVGQRLLLQFKNSSCKTNQNYLLLQIKPKFQIMAENNQGQCNNKTFPYIRCRMRHCGFGFGRARLNYTGMYSIVQDKNTKFFNVTVLPKIQTAVHGAAKFKRSLIFWKNDHKKDDARDKRELNVTAGDPFDLEFPQSSTKISHFHYQRPGQPSHELAMYNPFQKRFESYGFEVSFHQGTLHFPGSFPGMTGLYYLSFDWSTVVERLYNVTIFRPHNSTNHGTIYAEKFQPVLLNVSNKFAPLVQWFDPRQEEVAEKGPYTHFDHPNYDLFSNGSLLIKKFKKPGTYSCKRAFLRYDHTDIFVVTNAITTTPAATSTPAAKKRLRRWLFGSNRNPDQAKTKTIVHVDLCSPLQLNFSAPLSGYMELWYKPIYGSRRENHLMLDYVASTGKTTRYDGYFWVNYDANNGTLDLGNATEGKAGHYFSTFNDNNFVTRDYKVIVIKPWINRYHNISAAKQTPVLLNVSDQPGLVKVTWYDPNGDEIAEKGPKTHFDHPRYTLYANGSLLINKATKAGNYTCKRHYNCYNIKDTFNVDLTNLAAKTRNKRQAEAHPTHAIDLVHHTSFFPNFIKLQWHHAKLGQEMFILPLKYKPEEPNRFMWYKQKIPGKNKFFQISDFHHTLRNRDIDYDGDFDGSLNFTVTNKTLGSYLLLRQYNNSKDVIIVNHTVSTSFPPAKSSAEPLNTLGSDELELLKSEKYLQTKTALLLLPRNTNLTKRCSYRWYQFSQPYLMFKLARQNTTHNKTYFDYVNVTERGLMVHNNCGRFLLLFRCVHAFYKDIHIPLIDRFFHYQVQCLPQSTFETRSKGRKLLAHDEPYEPQNTPTPELSHLVYTPDPTFDDSTYYFNGEYYTEIEMEQTSNFSSTTETLQTSNFSSTTKTIQSPHYRSYLATLIVLLVLLDIIIICQCIWICKHHRSYRVVPVTETQL